MLLPPKLDRPRRICVPYSGSGSEMIGCMRAGWEEIIGIQRTSSEDEAQYVVIAKARLARWSEVPMQMDETEAVGEARAEKKKVLTGQVSLFDMPAPDPAPKMPAPMIPPEPATIIVLEPPAPAAPIAVFASTPIVETQVVAASTPIVVTPAIEQLPSIPLPTGEMAISELAQRLEAKGWKYTVVEIAQWAPERRAKAAKWVMEQS